MDLLTILLGGGVIAALITATSVVTQVILNKKLRTPADRVAEVNTVLEFFQSGIADSRADRIALEATTKDLREYIDKLEKDSREDYALRVNLENRITDLERRILEKDMRIHVLEKELMRYRSTLPADLEDTEKARTVD